MSKKGKNSRLFEDKGKMYKFYIYISKTNLQVRYFLTMPGIGRLPSFLIALIASKSSLVGLHSQNITFSISESGSSPSWLLEPVYSFH